jgi:hypothetical protein
MIGSILYVDQNREVIKYKFVKFDDNDDVDDHDDNVYLRLQQDVPKKLFTV